MRVLVVKFAGLRGALAATAGLRTIRERHPGAQVTFVTSPGSEVALEGCPAVVETIGFGPEGSSLALVSRLRRQRFDFALALGGQPLAHRLVALSGASVRACGGHAPFFLRPLMHRHVFGAAGDPHTPPATTRSWRGSLVSMTRLRPCGSRLPACRSMG